MKISLKPRYAVLIPSKGRPDILMKTLERQSFLNRMSTFIRVHEHERKMYARVRDRFRGITWFTSTNSSDNGCIAREELRKFATDWGVKRYVPTDDNARYSEESLETLVRASFIYPHQPCIVSGFHGTAPHFDSAKIRKAKAYGGLHFYEKWGAIFWCIPHEIYSQMSYPPDGGRMDDRFVSLAGLRMGCTHWVVCIEAPFTKPTGQRGGYSAAHRTKMMGQSVVRLAQDYPEYMEKITISFPWQKILEKARQK